MKHLATLFGISALAAAFAITGCVASEDVEGEDAIALDSDETIGEAELGIGNTYDIGVIPVSTSCPNGGALREIYMDDEDHNNASSVVGWVGASVKGTRFRFCRIDGSNFRPLASASAANTSAYYAVLKMGSQCPNGSFEFSRYFDNEDNNNNNSTVGDIEPSSQSANTTLVFCLFKYATPGAATMSSFPAIGISYGVFADYGTTFPLALSKGYIQTDDEDNNNKNSYSANADWIYDAQRIVSAGNNTRLGVARVQ